MTNVVSRIPVTVVDSGVCMSTGSIGGVLSLAFNVYP